MLSSKLLNTIKKKSILLYFTVRLKYSKYFTHKLKLNNQIDPITYKYRKLYKGH